MNTFYFTSNSFIRLNMKFKFFPVPCKFKLSLLNCESKSLNCMTNYNKVIPCNYLIVIQK